jgi:hypothetical protein
MGFKTRGYLRPFIILDHEGEVRSRIAEVTLVKMSTQAEMRNKSRWKVKLFHGTHQYEGFMNSIIVFMNSTLN